MKEGVSREFGEEASQDKDLIIRIPEVGMNTSHEKESKIMGSVEADILLSPFSEIISNV